MISLELFGDPVPQKRPRFARTQNHVKVYDEQKRIKEGYRWQLKSQLPSEPIKTALSVDIIFFMPVPKSTSGIKKRQMINGVIGHTKKPDIDNLMKFVLDCLNELAFGDDSQICEIRAKKIYAEKPRTLIRLIPLADEKRELLYENCARDS